MTRIYYLDGLGGNRHYASSLAQALHEQGLEMVYLPLPGHPDALDLSVKTPEALVAWFEASVADEQVCLMGYSLGADLAAYLAYTSPQVSHLVLLDGGIWTFEGYSLEQELRDSRAYIASQNLIDLEMKLDQEMAEVPYWTDELEEAVRLAYCKTEAGYALNLNEESILDLLMLRRDILFTLGQPDFATPCLLILADTPVATYQDKLKQVAKLPHHQIRVEIIANTSHQLYLEEPRAISRLVKHFIGT